MAIYAILSGRYEVKRYWYVHIEVYGSGMAKAAVIRSRLAERRPPEFYRQEFGREMLGEWFDSEAEAQAAAAEARALSAFPSGRPRAA
jgi:hypothetical protein